MIPDEALGPIPRIQEKVIHLQDVVETDQVVQSYLSEIKERERRLSQLPEPKKRVKLDGGQTT